MACRYTYRGKTYEAHEFDDVLRAMGPSIAAKYMPSVREVPAGPMVDRTDAWLSLALKRVIKMAADEGFDRVAFVTGQQTAERYNMRHHVDSILHERNTDGTYNIGVRLKGSAVSSAYTQDIGGTDLRKLSAQRLGEVLGEGIAKKIINREGKSAWGTLDDDGRRVLEGVDLEVGGEGHLAFYDKIVPAAVNKLLPKLGGGKAGTVRLNLTKSDSNGELYDYATSGGRYIVVDQNGVEVASFDGRGEAIAEVNRLNADTATEQDQPGFDITPAMREKAEKGLPLFSQDDAGVNNPRDYRDIMRTALREIHTSPGKVHWWHKSVGTQYNLAQRSKPFRRVFERVQDFLDDVSMYATEAANLAPNLLPKLETWKDITKMALPAKDTKAIAAPIFEGPLAWTRIDGNPVKVDELRRRYESLDPNEMGDMMVAAGKLAPQVLAMWRGLPYDHFQQNITTAFQTRMLKPGIRWTRTELQRIFGLNDKQADYYDEFRKATDKSITDLSVSDMLRFAGKDADEVRETALGMGDIGAVVGLLRAHLMEKIEAEPARDKALTKIINTLQEKADKAQTIIDEGYAPLSRFGHYTVDVVGADGKRLFFRLYENRIEAARAAAQFQKLADEDDGEFAGATVSRGTLSEEEYKLFAGVSPETVELFGEMLGLDSTGDEAKDKAFQAYLQLAKNNRSAMKRLIHRKGIAGFSEDVGRVLAGFVYSNARMTSRNLHAGEIEDAIEQIPKGQGELKDQAIRLRDYVHNPVEEAQALRGVLFAQYLGGSIAAALVNMTQPFTVTTPWLSQFGGIQAAGGQMRDALKVAWAKTTGDAALDRALLKATEEGIVAPQEVHQLMAQAQGQGALKSGDGTRTGDALAMTSNALSRLAAAWGKPFATAELFNRRVTFVAAYRTAVAQGMRNPYEFAVRAIRETQFIYNKGNKPRWARGALGATLMTFKTYSISYLELLERMWTAGEPGSEERAAGRRAVFFALGMILLMAGSGGLPFVEDVEDVVDGVAQRMGYNFSLQQKRREFLQEAFGKAFGGFLEKGVSGLPGAPIDVAGRLGLQNLVPGTGLFQKKESYTRDVTEVLGPTGDLATRAARAGNMVTQGRVIDAGVEASPIAARNVAKAIEMLTTGAYKDAKGYKVLDVTEADALAKGIGFQPGAVAKVQEADRAAQAMVSRARIREQEIAGKWAKGFAEKDDKLKAEARAEMLAWNEKNPATPIRIKLGDILKRAKNMQMSRAERIEKSAPKEVRAEARRLMREE